MLDTNVFSALLRGRPGSVLKKVRHFGLSQLGISSITLSELCYGAAKSVRQAQFMSGIEELVTQIEVASFDPSAARCYGLLRDDLERRGTPIGSMDTLIAAHALSLGAVLVSSNIREFSRVSGLILEDWS